MAASKRKWLTAASDISVVRIFQLLGVLGAVVAACILYTYQLGSFIGLAPSESSTIMTNRSLAAISAAPLNVPYQLLDWFFLHLPVGSLELQSRLASASLALLCGLLFYLVVRRWYGVRAAVLATALFVPSGWMLHTGRYGAGLMMLTTMVLGLIAATSWLNSIDDDKEHGWVLPAFAIICGFALLVPGGIWFVAAACFVIRQRLAELARSASRWQLAASAAIMAGGLASLAASFFIRPEQAILWLGLPSQLPELIPLLKQAAGSLTYLIARGPFLPDFWLAHTPALDAASTVLLLLGFLFYAKHLHNARVHLLTLFSLICIALIALNGATAVSYFIPVVYLVIATGLAYLIRQWFIVFPRNPFARALAISIVSLIVVCSGVFHMQRYFISWHYSPNTAQSRAQQSTE